MSKLVRRLSLALALPLVVGLPMVALAAPAPAVTGLTVQLTPNANPSVYGQPVRYTAFVWFGEDTNPVTDGSLEFVVDGVEQGAPVHLDATGHATSPVLVDETGLPLAVSSSVSDLRQVRVEFVPDNGSPYEPDPNPLGGQDLLKVDKAATSVAVLPSATTVVADVAPVVPGGTQAGSVLPSGPVSFTVDGVAAGPVVATNGRATLARTLGAGPHTVVATYAGDDRYTGSAGTVTRQDPWVEARVLSTFRPKAGWYRTAVDVFFLCRPQGSELTEDCPADVTLRRSGRDQSVVRTITAVDGGTATVSVTGIDIDRDPPRLTVDGRTCSATDALSGVKGGKCRIRVADDGRYVAVAVDRAGNRAVKRGTLG